MKEHERNEKTTKAGTTTQNLQETFVRKVFLTVFAVALLTQSVVLADLPGFRAPQLTTPVNPSNFSAETTPYRPGWSSVDAEIQELARGLKYDPGLMYKFVHDYIKFEPIWGDLKGPYMTWMDRSGGAFDQASLMIALLEEAEEHCTEYTVEDPSYVVGEIQLTGDDLEKFMNWFNVLDDPDKAKAVLARAGIYANVEEDNGSITSVKIQHVWVKVKIDGDTYQFDPSFKSHTKNIGLTSTTFNSAMGYTRSSFLSDAKQGSYTGTNYIQGLNKSNIRVDLDTYTDNLIDYIKDNLSDGGLKDLIGGLSIDPADVSELPPSSLPYTVVGNPDDEFEMAQMPDMYRTKLRIQHEGIDETFWSSEIYGRRLSLMYNTSDQPQLVLNGNNVGDPGNTTTEGSQYDLTLTVTHPYGTTDFNGTVTIKVTSSGFYNIVNGWGDTNTRIIEKHRADLEYFRYHNEIYSDTSEEVLGESFAIVGLTWLAQTSKMRTLAAGKQCDRPRLINHHIVGVAGQYGTPYIDMPLGHLGVYEEYYSDEIFRLITGHAAAYEHEVIRQLQDCNSVSTINLMEMANDDGTYDKIYSASNQAEWTSLQGSLHNYDTDEKALITAYINDDYTVYLPEHGDLSEDNWQGIGFQAKLSDGTSRASSYIISGGYSGGAATGSSDTMDPEDLLDRGDVFAGEREGTYHHSATDMTIGTGGMPFGLSLSRSYSSDRRLKDGPLGLGWTHNFDISAKIKSDSFQALGADSTIDAAAHIVALYVVFDILSKDDDSLTNNVIASLVESWLMDQMMDNVVNIEQGGGKIQFVKVPNADDPNGFYNPPTRQNLRLVLNDGNFRLKTPNGVFNDFDSSGRMSEWSNAFGSKVAFTYSSGDLYSVACKIDGDTPSWSLTFHYDANDRIDYVTDSASPSRTIDYYIDVDGNLTEYTNPDGNDTTYDYNDSLLTEVYSPLSAVDPILTNVYDSLGRLKQQTDANDNTTDYYLAGFRAETLEPAQTDPNNETKRFSTIVWADEHGRPISATDQLGRESTYEYDGKLRLIKSTSAYGTSSIYGFDQYDRIAYVNNLCKPGSPHTDPNVSVSYNRDSGENEDGRWFINQMVATDPNGYSVYHYYDYNDVTTYKTAYGYLMKIAYPEVEAGAATVEFTYDANNSNIKTKTDPNGIVTRYEYYSVADGATLKKVIVDFNNSDPNDHFNITTEYTYDSVGNVASVKDPRGNTTTFEYYDSRLLKKVTDPCSCETVYEYYADGKLKQVKHLASGGGGGGSGTVGNTTVFGNTTGSHNRTAQPCTMSEDGTITSICIYHGGGTGNILLAVYDNNASDEPGDRLGVTAATAINASAGWQTVDLTSSVEVDNGQELWLAWVFQNDTDVYCAGHANPGAAHTGQHWPYGMPDPFGDCWTGSYQFSIYANYTTSGGGGGGGDDIILQHITYNDRGLKETMQGPYIDGNDLDKINLTTFDYDALGRLTKVTDAEGNTTETRYYPDGKVWRVIDAEDHNNVTNTYDANGLLIKVEDARGNATQYEYNGFGGLSKTIYPDGTWTGPTYSKIREVRSVKTRARDIFEMWYDDMNRIKKRITPEGKVQKYKYDLRGRLIETYEFNVLAPKSKLIKNTYDNVGRITKVEYEGGKEVSYEYDACSNRTKLTYPDGSYITYEYDNLNRLTKIKDDSATPVELATYTYDSLSRRTELVYGNKTTIDYSYDAASRLTTIESTTDATHKYTYTYDKVGNRLTMLVNDTDTHTYTYDKIYQITDVNYPTSYESWVVDTTFNYDDVGNRSSVVDDGTTAYQANYLNQYNSVGGVYYDYDENGNTTFDGVAYYTYDSENRLISAVNASDANGGTFNAALDNFELTFTSGGGGGSGTVGNTNVFGSSAGSHNRTAQPCTMSEAGTIQSIAIYHYVGTGNILLAVYDNNESDLPGDRLGVTSATAINATEGWQTVDLTSSVEVTEGQEIWLAWVFQNDTDVACAGQANPGAAHTGQHWPYGLPDPFGDCWTGSYQFSIYANYTTSGGGDAAWEPTRPDANDPNFGGPDSLKSGDISANQETYFQTTVNGEGWIKFYYKKAAGTNDYVSLKVDGDTSWGIYNNPNSIPWTKKELEITGSSTHTLQWHYSKGSSGTSSDGGLWIDRVEWVPDTGTPPAPTLAEALDCDFTITTGGDEDWYTSTSTSDSYYDVDVAKSGSIDHSQSTWMQTIVTASAGDKVSFYWKVSSEQTNDYLKFSIDNVEQDRISGEEDWQKKSYSLSAGSRTLKWEYIKNGSVDDNDDKAWVDGLLVGTGSLVIPPDETSEALDSNLKFTESGDGSWFIQSGVCADYYYDGDAIKIADVNVSKEGRLQAIVESDSSETIKFHWKVSCQTGYDYLRFYIDGTLQDSITGEQDWQQKSYTVSSGIHTLKWVYDDGGGSSGDNCGWVDFVQWSGPSPEQDPSNFQTINYKYDLYGRRSEKKVDGFSTRYVYDGPHVIAEYDGNNNLLRKYIYGPGIDQPVCMIEEVESETYYYHYDGTGSVVALSDSAGDTVQTYEYSVFGQVAVEDINHPNPYMFAGRRFDIEIGLYYNRARYYNPYTGRFLQADPIGYGDGMNMYAYCGNSPIGRTDPSGSHDIPSGIVIDLFGNIELRNLVHIHVTIPTKVFFDPENVTGSDEQARYIQLWLRNTMGIDRFMPGWNIESVSFNSAMSVDVVITSWYNTWVDSMPPAPTPSFRNETVGGITVLVMTDTREGSDISEIALLDDRLLYMIMADQFNEILSIPRGQDISHYISLMFQYAHTPFRQSPDVPWWSYYGTIYHNSEVNYIGFGFASAHFYCLAHTNPEFRAFMRFGAPELWNLLRYGHFAGNDRYWYHKGYNWYPYSKYEPWWELFLP